MQCANDVYGSGGCGEIQTLSRFLPFSSPFLGLRRHPLRPHTLERLGAGIQRGFNELFETLLGLSFTIFI
jgi:hypothetical protein